MLSDDQVAEKFSAFLHNHHELVNQAVLEGKKSLSINFKDFDMFDMELSDHLLQFPETALSAMDEVLDKLGVLESAHVRFSNLPTSCKLRVRDIRAKHLAKLVTFDGLIRQAGEVRPEVVEMVFECESCGNKTEILQDDETNLKEPSQCFLCGKKTRFKIVSKDFVDVQKVVLEESPENLKGSEQPSRIDCLLRDDLVDPALRDKLTPGNQVNIVGVVKEIPIMTPGGKTTKRFGIFVNLNHIETLVSDFEELKVSEEEKNEILTLSRDPDIQKKLVASIAPSIYGFERVKEGVTLQLFGGVRKVRQDGVKSRGDMHILLVGDPGSAKSQMLKYVAQLAPKARYVTGKGATGAGLTATVVKDEFLRGWALEAGALVLASGGIGCIDELDKMSPEDRSGMHELMEQQTVSVSKANVQATLKAQVAVLGAANPKYGRFDAYQPIAEQINMPDTLLSRFDLIFAIRDLPSTERDTKLAEHILWLHKDPKGIIPIIPVDTMRKYIAYARKNFHPVINEEAINEIKTFFVGLRGKYATEESKSVPISARQLEALVRLSEASARMRLSTEATRDDAVKAIELLKYCLTEVGVDPETGVFDINRLEGVMPASQRGKVVIILELLREMEEKLNGPVPKFDLIEKAKEKGVPPEKVERLIDEMKMKGDIFEPRTGYIQKL